MPVAGIFSGSKATVQFVPINGRKERVQDHLLASFYHAKDWPTS